MKQELNYPLEKFKAMKRYLFIYVRSRLRLLLLSLLLFNSLVCINGQPNNASLQDVVMPAPNAASLGKYGDIPVSYYTGVPSIGVPIYTASEKGLSVPISLSYHSSGVKVAETASWVGLGWSLNAGGVITRSVLGLPDDSPNGYLNTPPLTDTINDQLSQQTIIAVSNGTLDGEADIFNFNLGGYSGKFFFDKNGDYHLIPSQDLKIEFATGSAGDIDGIVRFTIITPNGDKYHFGTTPANESTNLGIEAMDIGESSPTDLSVHFYSTSWYLVQIESADGLHHIDLAYQDMYYHYISPASCSEFFYICVNDPNNNAGGSGVRCGGYDHPQIGKYVNKFEINGKRLSRISTSKETIEFHANTVRDDLESLDGNFARRLDSITITSGDYCTKWSFSYDYFKSASSNNLRSDKMRLQLKSVQNSSCNGAEVIPPYRFNYYGQKNQDGTNYLPERCSYAIDHWGFYNGVTSNNLENFNIPRTTILGGINRGNSNRETDLEKVKYGVLNEIVYPTGGKTRFTFEANTYSKIIKEKEFIVEELENCPGYSPACCPDPNVFPFCKTVEYYESFTTEQVQDSIFYRLDLYVNQDLRLCSNGYSGKVTINIYDSNGTRVWDNVLHESPSPPHSFPETMEHHIDVPWNANETYRFELITCNARGVFNLWRNIPVLREIPVGGLRIKEVRSSPESDTSVLDLIKTYRYNHEINPDSSSGQLFREPTYAYEDNSGNEHVGVFMDASVVPLGSYDGYHIGYERVVEDFNGIGQRVYHFEKYASMRFNQFPVAPALADVNSGKLLLEVAENESGSEVRRVENIPKSNPHHNIFDATCLKVYPMDFSRCPDGPSSIPGPYYQHSSYWPRTSIYQLKRTNETIDGVTTSTKFKYDPQKRFSFPVERIFTNSDGKEHRMEMQFPLNINAGELPGYAQAANTEMIDRNIISSPVVTKKYIDGQLVGGSKNLHKNFLASNGENFPRLFQQKELFHDGSEKETVTLDYYSDGNINTLTKRGFAPETYTWQNDLPVTRSFLNFNWAYTYYPGTRLMQSMTDIKGLTSDYQYDPLMRLSYANARNGGLYSTYDYHYTLAGGGDYNTVDVFTSEDNVTRKNRIDGLGRSLQTTSCQYGPGMEDVVHGAVQYDEFGRILRQFQPFSGSCNKYTAPGGPNDGFEYESSPLSRELKRTFADKSSIQTQYASNTAGDAVSNFQTGGTYPAGELYKVTILDEKGHPTTSFKDKIGRVILIRKKLEGNDVDTYYQYDDRDNLIDVMPPGASSPGNIHIGYQYSYDERNRMRTKKLPGAGVQSFAYNDRDEVISSTDANGNIVEYQYDGHGRDTMTLLQKPFANQPVPIIYKQYDGSGGGSMGELVSEDIGILNGNGGRNVGAIYGYDQYGRLQTQRDRIYRGGMDSYNYTYDGATDRVRRIGRHYGLYAWTERYFYDHIGRETAQLHKMTRGSAFDNDVVFNRINNYDIKDQLVSKSLNGLQTLGYGYDLRGRLTRINKLPLVYDPNLSPVGPCGGGGGGGGPSDSLACGDIEVDLETLVQLIGAETEDLNVNCYDTDCPEEPTTPGNSCDYSVSATETLLTAILDESRIPVITYNPPLDLTTAGATDALADRIREFLDAYNYTYDLVDVSFVNGLVSILITGSNFQFGFIDFNQEKLTPFNNSCITNPTAPTGTSGQLAAQQSSLQTLSGMMASTTINTINYPTTLYQINLYEGKQALLLEEELGYLEGEGVTTGCTDITSSSQYIEVIVDDQLVNKSLVDVLQDRQNGFIPGDDIPSGGGCEEGIPLCEFQFQANASGILPSNHVWEFLTRTINLPFNDLSNEAGVEYSLVQDDEFWECQAQGELAWFLGLPSDITEYDIQEINITFHGDGTGFIGINDGNSLLTFNGGESYVNLGVSNNSGTLVLQVDQPEVLLSTQLEHLALSMYAYPGVQVDGVTIDVVYRAPCEPCSPNGPACTNTERQLQDASMLALTGSIQNIQASQLTLPTQLHRLRFCDGSTRYVFNSELNLISGSYAILQDVEITALDQRFDIFADGIATEADLDQLIDLRRSPIDLLIDDYGCPVKVIFSNGDPCEYKLYQENWSYANVDNTNQIEVTYDEVIKKTCQSIETEFSRKSKTSLVDIFKDYYVQTSQSQTYLRHQTGHLVSLNLRTKNPDEPLNINFHPDSVLISYPGLIGKLNPDRLRVDTANVEQIKGAINQVLVHAIGEWGQTQRQVPIADYFVEVTPVVGGININIAFRVYHITDQSYVSIDPSSSQLSFFDGLSYFFDAPGLIPEASRIEAVSRDVPCGFVSATYDDQIVNDGTNDWYQLPLNSPNPIRALEDNCTFSATTTTTTDCDDPKRVWDGNEFVDCENCEPEPPTCTSEEQEAQQHFRDSMTVVMSNLDINSINYPDSLLRILFCDGTEMYLFGSQAENIPGGGTVVQSVPIGGPGQTVGISAPSDTTDLFAMELKYEPNGNVEKVRWQVKYAPEQQYIFEYDDLDRMKYGNYTGQGYLENASYSESVTYADARGNIKTLARGGFNNNCAYELIDDLVYTYDEGNKVIHIDDLTNNERGFKERPGSGAEHYRYDANGNMVYDWHKGIDTISYNYLNLPGSINFGGSPQDYIYDASGKKHKGPGPREYANNIEFYNGLEAIYTDEGRVVPILNPEDGLIDSFQYEFVLRDHLGNSRVYFSDLNKDLGISIPGVQEVLQERHYYPFGLQMEGPFLSQVGPTNRYQYNGKEWNPEGDLRWFDYGARWYDPAVARWWVQDPLREGYYSWSPYSYTLNNPIRYTDPTGAAVESIEGGVRFTGEDAKTFVKALQQNAVKGIHLVFEEYTEQIYSHTLNAFQSGKPEVLTYDNNKQNQAKRRKAAIGGYPPRGAEGLERDEYPYASTEEGGAGALVAYVPKKENALQGGQLGLLYRHLESGDKFLVLPVPKDKTDNPVIPPIGQSAKGINSKTRRMRNRTLMRKIGERAGTLLQRAASRIPIIIWKDPVFFNEGSNDRIEG